MEAILKILKNKLWWLAFFAMACVTCPTDLSHCSEAHYTYDDLGRLTTVTDESGNTAIYNYDAVGNLLGIDRFTPGASGIGVYAVLPGKGAVSSQVKIQGYGFDPTPSNNTVTFNGTSAIPALLLSCDQRFHRYCRILEL